MAKGDYITKQGGGGVTQTIYETIYVDVPGETIYIEVPIEVPAPTLDDAIFGDAHMGNITYATDTTISSDVIANNVTINNAVDVTIGWNAAEGRPAKIYVLGTLTFVTSTSTIRADGAQGARPTGGAGGINGGDGGSAPPLLTLGNGNNAPTVTGPSIGGTGGHGGSGQNPTYLQGLGGTRTLAVVTSFADLVVGEYGGLMLMGGSGGGGGGNSRVGRTGGGGGGAGGFVHVLARTIAGAGAFSAIGARGSRDSIGAPDNAVGGPGGGGGIVVISRVIDPRIVFTTAPGTKLADTAPTPGTEATYGHTYLCALNPYDQINITGNFHPVVLLP